MKENNPSSKTGRHTARKKMILGGLQRLSLIDYPKKVSCVAFARGCNYNCPYCHNPSLVEPKLFAPAVSEKTFFEFLDKRQGLLDGVVASGGEPTLQKDLPAFLEKVREKKFLTKLDTNGSNPEMLRELLEKKLVDYIAMDYKAPLRKYVEVVRTDVDAKKIEESVYLIKESGLDYEFRTTASPALLSRDDFVEIARELEGANKFVLQQFTWRGKELLEPSFSKKTFSEKELTEIRGDIARYFKECVVRVYE
jgi:pyruvate formate lyase activating enzyme